MDNTNFINELKHRFELNMHRHDNVDWSIVESKLNTDVLAILMKMEETGGEPDIVVLDKNSINITFVDCSKETPNDRRSLCYDRQALDSRKQHKPRSSAVDMATEMGISILSEEQYRKLQELEEFDTKTSSWVLTPEPVRKLGGAIFCDRRFNRVFTYHNGAESYYASRGFRGVVAIK